MSSIHAFPRGSSFDAEGFRLVTRRDMGGYEVLASLGRGGAGEVFLALSEGPGGFQKLVVLKSLHAHFQEDPEVVAMFMDEARLAARLNHPNIVQTLEVGLHEGKHFIAMAYLEGVTLDRVLHTLDKHESRLAPKIAARIVAEMCSGLHYAHELEDYDGKQLQIVHRDISPANVSISWDGSVRLLDFGIAKAATRRANTDSGIIKGKFGYISPEQAVGEAVDRRADLWSAGVCLWEMLAGRRLFPRVNDVVTLQALVDGPLPSLAALDPSLPPELVDIVTGALQRDTSARFETALEMQQALEAWLGDQERLTTRSDIADLLSEHFGGARAQQAAMLRACVGGPVSLTPTGSYSIPPDSGDRVLDDEEPLVPLPWWQLAAMALALLIALGFGTAYDIDGGEVRGRSARVQVRDAPAQPARPERERTRRAPRGPTAMRAVPSTEAAPQVEPEEVVVTPMRSELTRGEPTTPPSMAQAPSLMPYPEEWDDRDGRQPVQDVAEGIITLDTTPWTEVWVGSRHLGQTPIVRVELPIGRATFRFVNSDESIETRRVLEVRRTPSVYRLQL